MKRKKTLADYWACIFLIVGGLMFYFAHIEPQADIANSYRYIAWVAVAAFLVSIGLSKWLFGEFFSNQSGGR